MKKLLIVFALGFTLHAHSQKSDFASEMENLLKSMKAYTIALAEQMPSDKFEYRPSESDEIRTFSQHLKHMRNFMGFQLKILRNEDLSNIGEIIQNGRAYESEDQTKEQVVRDLSERFDEVIQFYRLTEDRSMSEKYVFFFEQNQPSRTRRLISMALRDHITHHRAQAIIYLRENGITPVQYQRY